MPTLDDMVNPFLWRVMGNEDFKERALDFLADMFREGITAIYPSSGVLESSAIALSADTADTFDVGSGGEKVIDNGGHIVTNLSAWANNVPFQNANGIDYYVGYKYAQVPSHIEVDRVGKPQYSRLEESAGELGNPDAVSDETSYIRIKIDSILESGVSHAGRTARVWLVTPVSGDESVAFYEGTVGYAEVSYNYIDVPYSGSQGPLGQNPAGFSTTPADYMVHVPGVSWKRNTDLSGEAEYAYLGTVQGKGSGNTPDTFDTSDQELLGGIADVVKDFDDLKTAYEAEHDIADGKHKDVNPDTPDTTKIGSTGNKFAAVYSAGFLVSDDYATAAIACENGVQLGIEGEGTMTRTLAEAGSYFEGNAQDEYVQARMQLPQYCRVNDFWVGYDDASGGGETVEFKIVQAHGTTHTTKVTKSFTTANGANHYHYGGEPFYFDLTSGAAVYVQLKITTNNGNVIKFYTAKVEFLIHRIDRY